MPNQRAGGILHPDTDDQEQYVKITANTITIARIVLMPLPGILLYQGPWHLLVALFTIVALGFTDWLDGQLARRDGPTVLGGLLDPIADKIFIAVCFIPFAERTLFDRPVFPVWMLLLMFCRDFLVTSLRTSLSLRKAPMRTKVLAKYKTAIQMAAAGYLLAIVIEQLIDPASKVVENIMIVAAAIPLVLILIRLARGRRAGPVLTTIFFMSAAYAAIFNLTNANIALWVLVYTVTGITVFSGISYAVDTWSALAGKPGGRREMGRFILDGLLVPAAFLLPLAYYHDPVTSGLLIFGITLELASGGLANLLASRQQQLRFRWTATKSTVQVLASGTAIWMAAANIQDTATIGHLLIAVTFGAAFLGTVIPFWRHRKLYLNQF